MWKWISAGLLGIALNLIPTANVWASDDTQELQQFYSDYKAAIANGKYALAKSLAKNAWKTSEKKFGASRQTGDLAFNYAALGSVLAGTKRDKTVESAFEKSIVLANLHGGKSSIFTLKRQVEYGGYLINIGKRKRAAEILRNAEQQALSSGLENTEDFAHLMSGKSTLAFKKKKYQDAEAYAESALTIFDDLDRSQTKRARKTVYYLARAQTKLKKWREAMLGYEKVFINIDKALPARDQIIGRAFILHSMVTWGYMQENGYSYSDKPDLSNVITCVGCWPNFDVKYKPNLERKKLYDIKRVPPIMPSSANGSGFTVLIYDTNDKGKPINIRIIERSHARTFDKASIAAVRKWNVKHANSERPAKKIIDLVTIMTFRLTSQGGQQLDHYGYLIKG